MDKSEFASFRKKLKKTQTQMAQLLGISIKAIHSYEQGWRKIPPHIERQILFLISNIRGSENRTKSCWIIKKCPKEKKTQCPAWEFQSGKLCWFISGTICSGTAHKTWQDKIKICRECEVLSSLLL